MTQDPQEASSAPKGNSKRRMAIHQDVPRSLWGLTMEERRALRTIWRRQSSSSYLLFDDWGGSLADLEPQQQPKQHHGHWRSATDSDIRTSTSTTNSSSSSMGLLRRASARDRTVRSVSPSPARTPSKFSYQKLSKVEEPLDGSGSIRMEENGHPLGDKQRAIATTPSELDTSDNDDEQQPQWILYAIGVMVLGVGCSIPFNKMLASDPGSPLFISFVTHIFMVVCNLQKVVPSLISKRGKSTLPLTYHASCVILGYLFNVLRADAFVRLPPAVAMILMNCRMMVGMTFDFFVLGTRYSYQQVVSAGVVTVGIIWSGVSSSANKAATAAAATTTTFDDQLEGTDTMMSMIIGATELLLGLTIVTLLTTTVKIGFQRYGECAEEQIFFQHLFALPIFYLVSSQWQQIGPRLEQWIADKDWSKALLLLSNLILMFGHTHCLALFTARAPNMLLYQIVDSVKKFSIVVVAALGRAPPFPPTGFWGGSIVLVAGTLQFLSVSQPPKEDDEGLDKSFQEDGSESKKEK